MAYSLQPAAPFRLDLTHVVDGDLVKVLSWYDNEWGFTNQMVKEAVQIALSTKGGEHEKANR